MKKVIILICGLFLMTSLASAQVDDRAVIPVAVTLNSILRLNVVSGGNIEFNFNTLRDYSIGIVNSDAYNTTFTVASSVDWKVEMYAEDANFIGTDDDSGTGNAEMLLNNVGYKIAYNGDAAETNYTIPALATTAGLTNAPVTIVGLGAVPNAGDTGTNKFIINWECGTQSDNMNPQSILEQSIAADRYATNVFLILTAL